MTKLEFNPDGSIKIPMPAVPVVEARKEIDIERCRKIAIQMVKDFKNKEGVFSKVTFPRNLVVPEGVEVGSNNHLLYLTLTVSLDYMRDAEALWRQSYNALKNNDLKWIFDPKEVLLRKQNNLIELFRIIKDRKPIKDSEIWFKICNSLKKFDFSVYEFLKGFDFDALRISNYIADNKSDFPFLSGNKIKPLWLRMIDDTALIKLKNIHYIPLPIDTHTARLTLKIIYNEKFDGDITQNTREKCQKAWEMILKDSEVYPCLLDEPLWIIGKYNLLEKFMEEHGF